MDITTGHLHQSGTYGGNGGEPFNIVIPQGQTVLNIWVRTDGTLVTGIDVDFSSGAKAGWKGGDSGVWHCIATGGKRISGVGVRSGPFVYGLKLHLS